MLDGESLSFRDIHAYVDLASDLVRMNILRSLRDAAPLDDLSARVLASIIGGLSDDKNGILENFIRTGHTDAPDELRAVYHPLYEPPLLSPEIPVFCDYLGTHLANAQRTPEQIPMPAIGSMEVRLMTSATPDGHRPALCFATTQILSPEETSALTATLTDHAIEHGDAFRAWLRVPAVDARSSTLVEEFQRRFAGPVSSAEAARELPDDFSVVDVRGVLYAFRSDPLVAEQGGAAR